MRTRLLIAWFCFCWSAFGLAQSNLQWQGGLSLTIGQPITRIGFSLQFKYLIGDFAIDAEASQWYRFNGMGAKQKRWEGRYGLGGSVNFGHPLNFQSFTEVYPLIGNYEVKYLFLRYQDALTPQFSGQLSGRFKYWEVIVENDALAGFGKDQYRTGSVSLGYYFRDLSRVALDIVLWTGDTHCAGRIVKEMPRARHGYKDISACNCGKISHGIFQLRYNQKFKPGQELGVKLGIDSEWVRLVIQNKLMHDFVLRVNPKLKNPHIPMLNEKGSPWIDRENQKLRKTKFVLGIGWNELGLY